MSALRGAATLLAALLTAAAAVRIQQLPVVPNVDDFCFVSAMQSPVLREIPNARVPCVVTGRDESLQLCNVTMLAGKLRTEAHELPFHLLSKVTEGELLKPAFKAFDENQTLASVAVKAILADSARRAWHAEQRRLGLPEYQGRDFREEQIRQGNAVWEAAKKSLEAKEAAEASEAAKALAEKERQAAERREARHQQATEIEARLRSKRRGGKGRGELEALVTSLRRAQEDDDMVAKEEADRLAKEQMRLSPGSYRVLLQGTKVLKSLRPGAQSLAGLSSGSLVDVILVEEREGRVHGLIARPLGCITIFQRSSGLYFAERVDDAKSQ
mmetsp:Transcript_17181/g.53940  ORF Transcript_17181/g.53940 Transcript_17181/m.53940 type:complete len:328 (+) Transcript_17181:75-1058(+)